MNKRINTLFVTMFGLGKIKFMPGTFGSLATTILLYSSFHVLDFSANLILVGLIIIFIYSFYAVESYIKDNKDKDPREIIIDEFLGQSIPIFFYEISHGGGRENGNIIFIYFIFFYFSDVLILWSHSQLIILIKILRTALV